MSGMKQQTSIGSMMMSTGGGTVQMTSDSVSAIEDPAWPYEDEDLEVKLPHKNTIHFNLLIHLFLIAWFIGRRFANRLTRNGWIESEH